MKKIFLIFIFFFLSIHSSFGAMERQCKEYEIVVLKDKLNRYDDNPYFLFDIKKNYDYDLSISWEPYDCEQEGDFALYVPFINGDLTATCKGGGNNRYSTADANIKNLKKDETYKFYLKRIRDDRRGVGEVHLCYMEPPKEKIVEKIEKNILFGKNGFFETREDFISFMQVQGGIFMLLLILIFLYNINKLGKNKYQRF